MASQLPPNAKLQTIKAYDIEIALEMLNKYLDKDDIPALLSSLEALMADTQNDSYKLDVVNAFNDLGILQGAVLTYAPYLNIFISDDPFGD